MHVYFLFQFLFVLIVSVPQEPEEVIALKTRKLGEIEVNVQRQNELLKPGKCKGIWRPDALVGRCFGLKLHNEYEELKFIPSIESSGDCRALCCNMGDKCVSWQYQASSKDCRLGPAVRYDLSAFVYSLLRFYPFKYYNLSLLQIRI